jgi:hypothetical protein
VALTMTAGSAIVARASPAAADLIWLERVLALYDYCGHKENHQ